MRISKAAFLFLFLLSSGKSPLPSACLGEIRAKRLQAPFGEGRSPNPCVATYLDNDGFGASWPARVAVEQSESCGCSSVVFVRDTRRATALVSAWGTNGSLQTCLMARNGDTFGKQPFKGLLKRHGCFWFQQPFVLQLFLFSVTDKYCDPYFDFFKICRCIVKNKITKKRKNCSTR